MKIALSILALTVATPATAQTVVDDPAIVICEAVLKAKLKAPKSYERVDAKIVGDRVYITYDAVNVYNAPLREIETCAYSLGEDGTFSISSVEMQEATARLKALTSEMQSKSAAELGDKRVEEITREVKEFQAQFADIVMRSLAQVMIAEETGLHPIKQANTTLKASPSN